MTSAFAGADTLEITGVQVENGSTSSAYGHRDYGVELNRCQRYYTNTFDDGIDPRNQVGELTGVSFISMNRTNAGDDNLAGDWQFPDIMRVQPTITVYNTVNDVDASFYDQRDDSDILVSAMAETVTERRVTYSIDNASGGRILYGHLQAEAEF